MQTREKVDQPEEATVYEHRVDDIAIDQAPQDASMTKMRMDEMLMDQVMAVSCGTSRVCVNGEKYDQRQLEDCPQILSRKAKRARLKTLTT